MDPLRTIIAKAVDRSNESLSIAAISLSLFCSSYSFGADSLLEWAVGNEEWESPATEYDRLISDRPHVSEATATVGRGRVQLETGYTYFLENSGGIRTQTHSFAEPLLRVGMFDDWFELRLATNYLIQTEKTPAGLLSRQSGNDDMYLGAKVAIAKQRGVLPDLTIFPQMRVPTGTGGFSNERALPGVNIAYSWALSSFVELECNTVFNRSVDGNGEFFTQAFQTANFEFDLGPKWMGFAEFLFFQPWTSSPAAPRQNYFHTGLQYFITPDMQLDFHSAVGLNERADNIAFTGVGLCVRW